MEGEATVSVRCRLVRSDGSKWHIRELRNTDDGFRVHAVENGDGDPGAREPSADGASVLENEPLSRGDRVEWVEEGGEVLWSMTVPLDA